MATLLRLAVNAAQQRPQKLAWLSAAAPHFGHNRAPAVGASMERTAASPEPQCSQNLDLVLDGLPQFAHSDSINGSLSLTIILPLGLTR